MPDTINKRLFLILLPTFILMVIAGTLHHETGHYLAARWMGVKASIHYDYTQRERELDSLPLTMDQHFWFIICGPLQTMLTGTAALLLLCLFYLRNTLTGFIRYLLIFIAMLWVRQPVNLLLGLFQYFTKGYFSERGDEAKLSLYYHLPVWSLNAITALLGAVIIATIIFYFVPKRQQFTFWLAGTLGGAAGYYLWIVWLGKYILP